MQTSVCTHMLGVAANHLAHERVESSVVSQGGQTACRGQQADPARLRTARSLGKRGVRKRLRCVTSPRSPASPSPPFRGSSVAPPPQCPSLRPHASASSGRLKSWAIGPILWLVGSAARRRCCLASSSATSPIPSSPAPSRLPRRQADKRGYNVVLGHAHESADEAVALWGILEARHCDAILFLGDLRDRPDLLKDLKNTSIPVVALWHGSRDSGFPTVCVDNAAGIASVMDHLIGLRSSAHRLRRAETPRRHRRAGVGLPRFTGAP